MSIVSRRLLRGGSAVDLSREYLYRDPVTNRAVFTIPVQTTLDSIFFEDQMRLSSNANDITVSNIETNDDSYLASAILHDHSLPVNRTSVGVSRAAAPDFGELVDDGSGGFEPRGGPAVSGAVNFVLDTTLVQSLSIYEILTHTFLPYYARACS